MHWIAPLYSHKGSSIERLIQGDPTAWTVAGIILAIAAARWIYRSYRRNEPDRSQASREIPGTYLTEQFCSHCDRRVIVKPDGTCIGCKQQV